MGLRLPEGPMPANQAPNSLTENRRGAAKAKGQIQTKEKCRLECFAWLKGMMSNRRSCQGPKKTYGLRRDQVAK